MLGETTFRLQLNAIIRLLHSELLNIEKNTIQGLPSLDEHEKASKERELIEQHYKRQLSMELAKARRLAWASATLFLESEANSKIGASSFLPAPPQEETSGMVREVVRTSAGGLDKPETRARVRSQLDHLTEQAARDTIRQATLTPTKPQGEPVQAAPSEQSVAEHDERLLQARQELISSKISTSPYRSDSKGKRIKHPFAWARILNPTVTSPACGFCVICAARGPVYTSKKTALNANGKPMHAYHTNCRCIAVPVYTSRAWPGKNKSDEYAKAYEQVVIDQGLTGAKARTAMDKWARGDRLNEVKKSITDQRHNLVKTAKNNQWEDTINTDLYERDWLEEEKQTWDEAKQTLAKTLNYTGELPKIDVDTISEPENILPHWQGVKTVKNYKAGHSPTATVPNKTHVPAWWSFNQYADAVNETLQQPEYVKYNEIDGLWNYGKIVDDVLMSVTINPRKKEIVHAYPVVGRGVTWLDKNGLSRSSFRENKVRYWQRVQSA